MPEEEECRGGVEGSGVAARAAARMEGRVCRWRQRVVRVRVGRCSAAWQVLGKTNPPRKRHNGLPPSATGMSSTMAAGEARHRNRAQQAPAARHGGEEVPVLVWRAGAVLRGSHAVARRQNVA